MQFIASSVPTSGANQQHARGLTISGTFHNATGCRPPSRIAARSCSTTARRVTARTRSRSIARIRRCCSSGWVSCGGIPARRSRFRGSNCSRVHDRHGAVARSISIRSSALRIPKRTSRKWRVYNEVGVHLQPTGTSFQTAAPQGWQPDVVNWTQTLNADGSCTITPAATIRAARRVRRGRCARIPTARPTMYS
ncbi:DUF2957 domain-containing protein [Burkholderia pseudomallei]|uniref:DUF2957 domain-containing protein n=1 Tax=Burkholderia pseudomallei TaxID=28450 RepID=UPI003AB0C28A